VAVTGDANDTQQLLPAVAALLERMGEKPGCVMAHGGYVSQDNVEGMARQGIELVAGPASVVPEAERDCRDAAHALAYNAHV
jgi:hypothetical protein